MTARGTIFSWYADEFTKGAENGQSSSRERPRDVGTVKRGGDADPHHCVEP